jgi:hypothetical protein
MMHNWYEAYVVGLEMTGDRVRQAALRDLAGRLRSSRKSDSRSGAPTATGLRGSRAVRVTLVLSAGEMLSLRVRRRPHRVVCVAGRVWATEERSAVDHVLAAGEQRTFEAEGRLVIQALRTSTVRIECPRPARVVVGSTLRPALVAG